MRILTISLAFLFLIGCEGAEDSGVQSVTGPGYRGTKQYFAFNGGDRPAEARVLNTVFEPMFDANNLGRIFSSPSGGNYRTDVTYDTSKVNSRFVLSKLDYYSQTLGTEDMFIMYTGSHGTKTGLRLDGEVLPYQQIVDRILRFRAKEVVVFMMACHSGAFANALTRRYREYSQWAAQGRTLFILASSQADEISSTFPKSKLEGAARDPLAVPGSTGSAYGHVLWQGLEGRADFNGDRMITLKELYDYVVRGTQELGGHKPAFAGDFPHSLVMRVLGQTSGTITAQKQPSATLQQLVQQTAALRSRLARLVAEVRALKVSPGSVGRPDAGGPDAGGPDAGRPDGDDNLGDGAPAGSTAAASLPSVTDSRTTVHIYTTAGQIDRVMRTSDRSLAGEHRQAATIANLLGTLNASLQQLADGVYDGLLRAKLLALYAEGFALYSQYVQVAEKLRVVVVAELEGRSLAANP